MQVTKELPYSKAQSPTSLYLNSKTQQEATCVSLKLNEELLSPPTTPHVNRLWKINVDGIIVYYSTPSNLFRNTGLARYFRSLLDYQETSGIIEPKDLSALKFRKLFLKLNSFLTEYPTLINSQQKDATIKVLLQLSRTINVSINDVFIQANVDNELVILKKGESGRHYIVIGDNDNDISYLFVSNYPGFYTSLHLGNKITLKNIIDSFSSE